MTTPASVERVMAIRRPVAIEIADRYRQTRPTFQVPRSQLSLKSKNYHPNIDWLLVLVLGPYTGRTWTSSIRSRRQLDAFPLHCGTSNANSKGSKLNLDLPLALCMQVAAQLPPNHAAKNPEVVCRIWKKHTQSTTEMAPDLRRARNPKIHRATDDQQDQN